MKIKLLFLALMTFAAGNIYPQQKFEYRTTAGDKQLEQLAKELIPYRNNPAPEAMSLVYNYLADKPVQILQDEQVWNVVGPFVTSDPYSRPYAYVCSNINRYPLASQVSITNQLNIAMSRAISSAHLEPEEIELLKENLRKYVLPKSGFYMARLDINRHIHDKNYTEAFSVVDYADRLGLFYKEERYLLDTYRKIVEETQGNRELAQKILNNIFRMQSDSKSRTEANIYDIIAVCYKSMGNHKLAGKNMKIYQEKYDRMQEVNKDFLEMVRRMTESK